MAPKTNAPGETGPQATSPEEISAVSVPREVQILLSIGDTKVRRGDAVVMFTEDGGETALVERLEADGPVVRIYARFVEPVRMGRTARLEIHGNCGVMFLGKQPEERPADCVNTGAEIRHKSMVKE